MAVKWVVTWSSFSPSIPTRDRKLRSTSIERRQDFEDPRPAVYFVMENLTAKEQLSVRLHTAGGSFDLENIKAMYARYQDDES